MRLADYGRETLKGCWRILGADKMGSLEAGQLQEIQAGQLTRLNFLQ
jgi:hypothetical protein